MSAYSNLKAGGLTIYRSPIYGLVMSTETTTSRPLPARIADGLTRVAAAMRADEWQAAEAGGLTPTQMHVLRFVAGRDPVGVRVKEIAADLGVTQPTATDAIAALERKGHVHRAPSVADRRAVTVTITDSGIALLHQASDAAGAALAAVAGLDAAEQERLLMSLVRVIRNLQEAGAIPIQRMCATCRYFRPHVHDDAAAPHHCAFVDAAFGSRDFRVDCREHETADPAARAATWAAFTTG